METIEVAPIRIDAADLEAVIFDFDGVLVESTSIKTDAFAQLFAGHGDAVVKQVVRHHLENAGVSRYEKIRHYHANLLGSPITAEEVDAEADRFGSIVEDLVVKAPEVDGATAMLDRLGVLSKPAFVASATPAPELRRIIERRGLAERFNTIYGSPVSKLEAAREVIEKFGFPAQRILFVGDAKADRDAATQAGCRFVGRLVPGERSPFPAETQTVTSLSEIVLA